MQVYVNGALPLYESNRSYFIVECAKPFPKTVNVVIPPSKASEIRIFLLADVSVRAVADVESTAELAGSGYRQKTEVTLNAESSGEPIPLGGGQSDAEWEISILSPSGGIVTPDHITLRNGKITFDLYPEIFGEYTIELPQTSRTLALDEFNPQAPDLLTEIGDTRNIDSLDDETVRTINDRLLCRSFSEFMEKMRPTVYSFYDVNSQTVRYTLKKPESLPDNLTSRNLMVRSG